MKTIRNMSGNSLLSVLLMITLFSIICLAFISYSFTTSKQNDMIENQTLSVAFAEMGISYVETAIKDIYYGNQARIDQEILHEMETGSPETDYTDLAIEKMNTSLHRGLEKLFKLEENYFMNPTDDPIYKKSINSDELDPNIVIKNFHIDENLATDSIIISFTSEGKDVDGKKIPLKSQMTINITQNEENNGGLHVGIELPSFGSISEPEKVDCDFPKNCDEKLIKPAEGLLDSVIQLLTTITNNINNTVNKTIFSTKGLTLNGNLNSSENLKLHAVKTIKIASNMHNAKNIILETRENLFLEGNTDFLGDSKIYVGKTLQNTKHLNISGNTIALVEENVNIKDKFNMSSNAKMCVKGNVNIDDLKYITIDSDIGLIVKNKVFLKNNEGKYVEYTESITGISTGTANYEKICECLPYSWAETVTNDVDYQ